MRSAAEVERVLALKQAGLSASVVSRATGLPRATVRDWMTGSLSRIAREAIETPGHSRFQPRCRDCGVAEHDFTVLPACYPYLLGMYLGDGCISIHARGVGRLRVHLDLKYPLIIEECREAIGAVLPRNRVHSQLRSSNYTGKPEPTSVVLSAYSKSLPCFFPQHGPGQKHERVIVLESWQLSLVERAPGFLLRGLIHSDGCRFINTGRNWRHPRYSFRNKSEDIRKIFIQACGMLGLHTTEAPETVYVSRKADVATLDRHIGPKR